MLASFCKLFIAFRFFISLNFTIARVCSFCCKFTFRKLIVFLSLCIFACEFSINASSELNMYYVFLFADVNDFCWLWNKSTMLFCSCLLVDELMLSSSHKLILIFNVDFLISIVDVLNSDSELLLLLSFALSFAKQGKKERIKRLFIFLFIKIFSRFKLLIYGKYIIYIACNRLAMKLICMRCWLRIYCLAIVKFKDYQKFEQHQCVAWLQSAVRWLHAEFSWSHRHW